MITKFERNFFKCHFSAIWSRPEFELVIRTHQTIEVLVKLVQTSGKKVAYTHSHPFVIVWDYAEGESTRCFIAYSD